MPGTGYPQQPPLAGAAGARPTFSTPYPAFSIADCNCSCEVCPSPNCTVASWLASDTLALLTPGTAVSAASIVPTQPPQDIPVTFRISVCIVTFFLWWGRKKLGGCSLSSVCSDGDNASVCMRCLCAVAHSALVEATHPHAEGIVRTVVLLQCASRRFFSLTPSKLWVGCVGITDHEPRRTISTVNNATNGSASHAKLCWATAPKSQPPANDPSV